MPRLSPIYAAAALAVCTVPASARPPFLEAFQQTFTVAPNTPLAGARCQTCHVPAGPPERNPYGSEVRDHLQQARALTVTAAVLRETVPHESDGDGWGNGDEIRAGTLPGDRGSAPAGSPGPTPPAARSATRAMAPLIPLHSFHPLVVHFPIALFVLGGLLELAGARRRMPGLRDAGFLNIGLAAVLAFAAAGSGVTTLVRNGFPLSGLPLAHMSFALSATAGMVVTALLGRAAARAGRPRTSVAYWTALLVSMGLVAVTGHLGATIVYG